MALTFRDVSPLEIFLDLGLSHGEIAAYFSSWGHRRSEMSADSPASHDAPHPFRDPQADLAREGAPSATAENVRAVCKKRD